MLIKTILRHPFRVLGRGLWLCGAFIVAALDYLFTVAFRDRTRLPVLRSHWLQRNSRRVLRVVNTQWDSSGPVPTHGLLVCNHLSYLDILLLAAVTPAAFVSKSEVKSWPVFGFFAVLAGTVFVKREKRTEVVRANSQIREALANGSLLVLFPEGTSSDGQTVLPFKSALLEPALEAGHDLSVGHIRYTLAVGSVPDEVCYWRDMTLLPHLINLLGKKGLTAHVAYARIPEPATDRKLLARQLHAEVLKLMASGHGR